MQGLSHELPQEVLQRGGQELPGGGALAQAAGQRGGEMVSPGDLSWEEGGGTVSPWICGGLVGGEDICCIVGVWPKRGVCALINTKFGFIMSVRIMSFPYVCMKEGNQ